MAGFLSKWYMMMGAFDTGSAAAVAVLTISTLLNAAYFLPIIHAAFFRSEDAAPEHPHGEAPWPMLVAMTASSAATVALFLFPEIALSLCGALVMP